MTRRRFGVTIGSNKMINKEGQFRGKDKYLEDINNTNDQPPGRKDSPCRCISKNIKMNTLYTIVRHSSHWG